MKPKRTGNFMATLSLGSRCLRPGLLDFQGEIVEIAKTDLKVVPREIAAGDDLSTRVDKQGVPRPVKPSYHARAVLDPHSHEVLTGAHGRAKILVGPQSAGQRLYRYLRRTFTFEL